MPVPTRVISRRSRRTRALGFDGRLQGVADGHAIGWAWDADNPDQRITVSIEIDGQVAVSGVAALPRDDLAAEGIGDGAHGFSFELPAVYQSHAQVLLVAVVGPSNFVLPRSPSFWQDASPGGLWRGVHFGYGREGDPEAMASMPVVVPPPPEPAPLRALVGDDGWLFDAVELQELHEPDGELLDRVTERLLSIARASSGFGVAYVPALVPNKLQALAEQSPVAAPWRGCWPERLAARLRDLDDVDLLDLMPVLADARVHGACYDRGEPGFNDRGAFFVARGLLKEARKRTPALAPLPLSSLHLTPAAQRRGALADAPMLRFDGGSLVDADLQAAGEPTSEIDISLLAAQRLPVERHMVGEGVHVRLYGKADGGQSPRLAIVGGRDCLSVLPWLAESAQRTTFFWACRPPMESIELELPDTMLHLIRRSELEQLAAGDQPPTA